jgi:hypothetical protein
MTDLPDYAPPSVVALWDELTPEQREALLPRILGRSPVDRLVEALRKAPRPIGATTIKNFRRAHARHMALNSDRSV